MSKETYTERLPEELELLPAAFTAAIRTFMSRHKIDQATLAAMLGVTPGRVSQILSGDANLTLRTLASVAAALDARFEVTLAPHPERTASTVEQGASAVWSTSDGPMFQAGSGAQLGSMSRGFH
ncbi:helix-turn-helix domain-containing protein [Longimycelium tulufanense]|uniref:helix-turn-helix domain-containing protein n=1 Tax=Longimycelium tulufanense TaxID=907463 RepID=UPI001E51A2FB|nr:helix-turn-helix transcriptional regulator [Longimycelium tulufanense]